MKYVVTLGLALSCAFAQEQETRALEISAEIQAKHLPFGTILSPMYASPSSDEIRTYTRCGDSAIWTGHWLAAEAFRYAVTKDAEALRAVRTAFHGVQALSDVTGSSRILARCLLDPKSRFARGPRNEERHHGEYTGQVEGREFVWIGNTSRDQYMGVFFGLSVAWEHVPELRPALRPLATRLIERLIESGWNVSMPDEKISTVFWHRPDQVLAILQTGRQVNPDRFGRVYEETRSRSAGLNLVMEIETVDVHDSYFKFNLNAITWFNLLRLEEADSETRDSYVEAYRVFRTAVASHGNAFFNLIDRALVGEDARRDAETRELLAQWLLRPRRDNWVDLRSKYKKCGDDRACEPIPVAERVRTDFLWQRSPFLLYGGGEGRIEGAGVDFLLPYWMSRYYAASGPVAVSAQGDTRVGPAR